VKTPEYVVLIAEPERGPNPSESVSSVVSVFYFHWCSWTPQRGLVFLETIKILESPAPPPPQLNSLLRHYRPRANQKIIKNLQRPHLSKQETFVDSKTIFAFLRALRVSAVQYTPIPSHPIPHANSHHLPTSTNEPANKLGEFI